MTLSSLRRKLMLEIIDGQQGVPPLMFHLHQHYKNCDRMLNWLVKNNLKGKKLLDWIKVEHKGSPLAACSYILGKVNRENGNFKIILGKDFV